MKIWMLVLFMLTGCASKLVPYSPEPVNDEVKAAQVIEQVIMQQPDKHRPESVSITKNYIAFGEGLSSTTTGFSSGTATATVVGDRVIAGSGFSSGVANTTTKYVGSRIYFNMLGKTYLYTKRDWFILDVRNKSNKRIKRVYTRDRNSAEAFIDSLHYMAEHSTPIKAR